MQQRLGGHTAPQDTKTPEFSRSINDADPPSETVSSPGSIESGGTSADDKEIVVSSGHAGSIALHVGKTRGILHRDTARDGFAERIGRKSSAPRRFEGVEKSLLAPDLLRRQ